MHPHIVAAVIRSFRHLYLLLMSYGLVFAAVFVIAGLDESKVRDGDGLARWMARDC